MNPDWHLYWDFGARTATPSWINVPSFFSYHTNNHYENGDIYAHGINGNLANDLAPPGTQWGDALMYNWNDGGDTWDHLSIDTDIRYFGTYFDAPGNAYYVLNRNMTSMAQHTSNRLDAPWNFGWIEQIYRYGNVTRANGMRAKTIHVRT
jgi:hypothetical protein